MFGIDALSTPPCFSYLSFIPQHYPPIPFCLVLIRRPYLYSKLSPTLHQPLQTSTFLIYLQIAKTMYYTQQFIQILSTTVSIQDSLGSALQSCSRKEKKKKKRLKMKCTRWKLLFVASFQCSLLLCKQMFLTCSFFPIWLCHQRSNWVLGQHVVCMYTVVLCNLSYAAYYLLRRDYRVG